MKTFLRDMFIGWIIYTDSGKKVANKIVNYCFKYAKNNVLSLIETQFDDKKDNRNNNAKQNNNRAKN